MNTGALMAFFNLYSRRWLPIFGAVEQSLFLMYRPQFNSLFFSHPRFDT